MTLSRVLAAAFLSCGLVTAAPFVRGDVDQSGNEDISDAVNVLLYLFAGDWGPPACLDAADVNDSGAIDLADAVYSLSYLFGAGPPPPAPFPSCGSDLTDDDLTCEAFFACDSGPGSVVRSGRERDLAPDVSEEEMAELVAGNTAFALDLYHAVAGGSGNLFFSPFSVSVALAMLHAGARGDTEGEMAETLHFTLPQEDLHAAFNALDLELARRAETGEGDGFRLNIVNSIWGQDGYSFLSAYLDTLAEHYDAGMRLLDFVADADSCRSLINDWVSDETEGRIVDLLPPGSVTEWTRLVLTNAIYFNAAWLSPFPEELTEPGEFHLLDGATATVPFMRQTLGCGFAARDGFTAVELPYEGNELSMLLVVPDPGRFEEVEEALDGAGVAEVASALAVTELGIGLPRFGFSTELPLADTLRGMGMPSAFVPVQADFSGIDGTRDLFVSGVFHKAYVSVDEAGTEAAAATGVVVGITAVPEQVDIDRPFLFFIRDIPTGAVLFVGRVLDPRG